MTIFVLQNGTLFDGQSAELLEGGCVVVEDGTIREVNPRPVTLASAVTIDCTGHTIMPGLIDAHVHVYLASSNFDAIDRMPRSLLSQYDAAALRGALERGFTTVRDACGADYGLVLALAAPVRWLPMLGPTFWWYRCGIWLCLPIPRAIWRLS